MINNKVKSAKFKLSQHRSQGSKSQLNIFQVAKLMDTIKRGEDSTENSSANIFFSLN
jgi:hypothetical protein